jgi:predicted MPP superfamily phosphohydrolase
MQTAIAPSKITTSELFNALVNITESTTCSITYMVDDNRSKTIKGLKQVQKRVRISNVYLNHDYTNKVINKTGNEEFVAEEMKGKTRISGTIIQADKTKEFMIDGKVLYSEAATVLGYFHNGIEITETDAIVMQLWTPSYYNPAPIKTMGRGTVSEEDNFRIINTYLSRIEKIKFKKVQYEMI